MNEFQKSGSSYVDIRLKRLLDSEISEAKGMTNDVWSEVKTAAFTAEVGGRYILDATAGNFTVTLPASASSGDRIEFLNVTTGGINNPSLDTNGKSWDGGTGTFSLTNELATLTYIADGTANNWLGRY